MRNFITPSMKTSVYLKNIYMKASIVIKKP